MSQTTHFQAKSAPRDFLRMLYGVLLATGVLILLVHLFLAIVRGFGAEDLVRLGLDLGVIALAYLGFEMEAPDNPPQSRRGAAILPFLGLYLVFVGAETGGLASPFFLLVLCVVVFAGLSLPYHKAILLTAVIAAAHAAMAWLAPPEGFIGGDLEEVRSAVTAGRTMSTERLSGVAIHCGLLFLGMFLAGRVTRRFSAQMNTLADVATRDPLTQLANRRGFTSKVERELQRAERYAWPISLMIIDLDHFKQINDTYGHGFGDRVLCEAARILQDSVGPMDHLGRIGGEEFAIAAVAADPNHGAEVAMSVLRRFRQHRWDHLMPGVKVTCSIGVSVVGPGRASAPGGANLSRMLDEADRALYEVKEAGRNDFRVAGQPDFRASQVHRGVPLR